MRTALESTPDAGGPDAGFVSLLATRRGRPRSRPPTLAAIDTRARLVLVAFATLVVAGLKFAGQDHVAYPGAAWEQVVAGYPAAGSGGGAAVAVGALDDGSLPVSGPTTSIAGAGPAGASGATDEGGPAAAHGSASGGAGTGSASGAGGGGAGTKNDQAAPAAGTQAAGTPAAGTQAADTKAAGTQAAGTQAAGTQAARTQGGGAPSSTPQPADPAASRSSPSSAVTNTTRAPSGLTRRPSVEAEVLSLTNRDRRANGKGAVSRDGCMDGEASGWARHMAETRVMSHSASAGRSVTGCRGANAAWADNVGNGLPCSAAEMQRWWMSSSGHRASLLGARYVVVGIGVWADATGRCWFQVYFGS